jgi:hypothetical protein
VTICTRGREHVFGAVVKGEMLPNESGREVARCWTWLAERYPYVYLDEWIVMPDHTRAIIVITGARDEGARSNLMDANEPCRGGSRTVQLRTATTTDPVNRKTDGKTTNRRNANRWDG